MSDVFIFGVGICLSLVTATAVGLIVWVADREPE
jgi:hypothetical protein